MNDLILGFNALEQPVYLGRAEQLAHAHIIGSSGSGKSKFLEHLMRQHFRRGQGFCLIDPHGTLYDAVVDYAAHYALHRDIVLLNFSEPSTVIGFNPFQRTAGADLSVQVQNRIKATMHAWNVENTDETPTLARTLWLIYAVMLEHNLGLPQAAHLIDFSAKEIRGSLIEQLSTPLIRREWEELQRLPAKEWRGEILSAKNRLFKFLTSETLSRFMGLPGHAINLQEIIEEDKILLVNLAVSDHFSDDDARTVGALLVNEFFEVARRRKKDERGRDPHPYYLFLDEFQDFVSLDLASMLDQVRKFGLFLTMAHQRFGQLDENMVDAVLTNAKIKAVFGGLPVPSARTMAEELFIGEIDPMKVKAAIYQTKFWPTYAREKVYTKTTARSTSVGTSESQGFTESQAFGAMSSAGMSQAYTGADWFGTGAPVAAWSENLGSSNSSMQGSGKSSGTSRSEAYSESESYGEADIPIFIPVPFQELSSVQYFSPEEQLLQLTAALKGQFPRHCFIKIHDQATQPLLVPFVNKPYTREENKEWYVTEQLTRQHALDCATVDRLLKVQDLALLQKVQGACNESDTRTTEEAPSTPKQTDSAETKRTQLGNRFIKTNRTPE